MIPVSCFFGRFEVSFTPGEANSCRESIVIEPKPKTVEEENRVLRLALYDLAQGYVSVDDLKPTKKKLKNGPRW